MTFCPKCEAVCLDKKDEKRFLRRHPKKCQSYERFHRSLLDTKSVEYDEAHQEESSERDPS